METFSVEVKNHPRYLDIATFHVQGILYANTLVQFEKAFQGALASAKKNLVIDLTETNYVSSGGWSMLLVSLKRVKEMGGTILLAGMKPEIHDAFELMEYDKDFSLFPTVEAAITEGFGKVATVPTGAAVISYVNGLT